ncbi:hypothetical protein IVO30_001751 [Salmonella enterica]|nr:hypothetical protein [Salmonella enterica]
MRARALVFPAPAGINRQNGTPGDNRFGVPRASGDKPVVVRLSMSTLLCSPRQRG